MRATICLLPADAVVVIVIVITAAAVVVVVGEDFLMPQQIRRAVCAAPAPVVR